MSRLVLVSNRLPITIEREQDKFRYNPSSGGLATGLSSFHETYESLWLGWCGIANEDLTSEEEREVKETLKKEYGYYPVPLSQKDIDNYYYGFCNNTIWPLFHYFTQFTRYENDFWNAYKRANQLFFEELEKVLQEDDILWIHDYHLLLLPKMIRNKFPDVKIGFFLHIPFPSFELFRLLPWKEEILEGLLGSDLIGFHSYDYVRHFLSSALRIGGYENSFGEIRLENRIVKIDEFPMGIDYEKFSTAPKKVEVQSEMKNIRKEVGDKKLILSVDRLDYTKGIPIRLKGYEHFLEQNKEYREKVTMIMVSVPSRTKVESYQELKTEVDTLVGQINGKYSTVNWIPLWYLFHPVPFERLAALYAMADVALVTPVRDGMNLVAKEYVASRKEEGVLVLSEMAGAAQELSEAVFITPTRKEEIAESILLALKMSEKEQKKRIRNMQRRLKRYTVTKWAQSFIEKLTEPSKVEQKIEAIKVDEGIRKEIIKDYEKASKRLLLLDYDGTLVPFVKEPDKAVPNQRVLGLLEKLEANPKNRLVIISGRDKDTLGKWFKDYDFTIISEHGVWIRKNGKDWEMLTELDKSWKQEIMPILRRYEDNTPGSLVEEKSFSLAWHYRKSEPEFGSMRAKQLKDNLIYLTRNLDLNILEGSKVIEIKNKNINKGKAIRHILDSEHWDFVFAAGDDWTDEDMFQALPDYATSIKVRYNPTIAKYTVKSCDEFLSLLEDFV